MKIEGSVISFLLVELHEVKNKVSTFLTWIKIVRIRYENIVSLLQALFDCQNDFSYPILTAAIVHKKWKSMASNSISHMT